MTRSSGRANNGSVELQWERFASEHLTLDEPLLLVNGLGSPLVSYELGFVQLLCDAGFSVVRFDNRDAGKSTVTSEAYGLRDMVDDTVAVLQDVGWSVANVFGMSMGGMIVQQMAIDHPDRVTSVVSLMSTTGEPGYGRPTEAAMDALMTPAPEDRDGWIAHRLSTETAWATPGEGSSDWNRAKAELLYDYGVSSAGVRNQYRAVASSGSREAGLRALVTPMLVLHGSEDTLIQPDGGRRTAQVVPGAEFQMIQGMGHDLPPRFWPQVVRAVAGFVPSQ